MQFVAFCNFLPSNGFLGKVIVFLIKLTRGQFVELILFFKYYIHATLEVTAGIFITWKGEFN